MLKLINLTTFIYTKKQNDIIMEISIESLEKVNEIVETVYNPKKKTFSQNKDCRVLGKGMGKITWDNGKIKGRIEGWYSEQYKEYVVTFDVKYVIEGGYDVEYKCKKTYTEKDIWQTIVNDMGIAVAKAFVLYTEAGRV